VLLLAVPASVVVSNLFASQPIVAEIGASLGMASRLAGCVSTVTMLGYGAGMVFLLPLLQPPFSLGSRGIAAFAWHVLEPHA
jgi:hypothetical protein